MSAELRQELGLTKEGLDTDAVFDMLGSDAESGMELMGSEQEGELQSLSEMLREAREDAQTNSSSEPK